MLASGAGAVLLPVNIKCRTGVSPSAWKAVFRAALMVMPFVAPGAVYAQSVKTDSGLPTSDAPPAMITQADIVVTATRSRAQTLQSVPMAISAVQARSLETRGIDNISDIVKSVPSVNVTERGPGQSQVTIRGVSAGAFSITETGDRPLVSVYLDDVPISIQGANPDLKVFDLERVEILRGPQGTLYGSGSMAGTIRYITKKPDAQTIYGAAEGALSSTAHAGDPNWNVRGSINLPIVKDSLALLATAYTGRDAGFINNIGIGKKDANDSRTTQARAALRWTGVDRLTVDLSALYTHLTTGGLPVAYSGLPAYTYDSKAPEFFHDRLLVLNGTVQADLGFATLSSATSYIDRNFTSQTSGFSYEYVNGNNLPAPFHNTRFPSAGIVKQQFHTLTEEVRLVSDKGGPLSWSVGIFYEHTTRNYNQINPIAGLDAGVGLRSDVDLGAPGPNILFSEVQSGKERQIALFGEATYKVLPALEATAGLRYFDFQQNFSLSSAGLAGSSFEPNPAAPPTFLPLTQIGSPKARGVNPRFVLSYKPETDTMIFAEASRGFRYGSVNEPVAPSFCGGLTAPATVGPDNLWNYAIGLKSQLANRRITFNATGFYIDWRNVQARQDLYCGYYYRVNQGRITSRGVELETTLKVTRELTINLNGSYTDAKSNSDFIVPGSPPMALDGDRAPLSPRWIGALSAQYVVPVGRAHLSLTSDLQYRSNFYNRFRPDNSNYRETPGQTILNASLNYEIGNLQFGIFGTNLTNSPAYSFIDAVRGGNTFFVPPAEARFYGKPRTVGLRTRVKF